MKFDNELIIKLIKTAIYIVIGIVIYNIIAYLVKKIAFKDKVTDQEIIRKIIIYSFPLVMIDIFKSLYSYVDMYANIINSYRKHMNRELRL